jgi:hypothetical protein
MKSVDATERRPPQPFKPASKVDIVGYMICCVVCAFQTAEAAAIRPGMCCYLRIISSATTVESMPSAKMIIAWFVAFKKAEADVIRPTVYQTSPHTQHR